MADSTPAPTSTPTAADDGVVRMRPESSLAKVLPTFILEVLEFWATFITIHYMQWFWFVSFGLYYLHTIGYTYVSLGLILAYLPIFFNGAHLKPTPEVGGMQCDYIRMHPIWHLVSSYLKIDIVREAKLDPSKQYVFGGHPHGILILNRLSTFGGHFETLFPGIKARLLGATPMFYIPLARELSFAMNAVDASAKNAARVLNSKISCIVFPGGSKEIFLTDPKSKETTLVLSDRLGFVKLAIRHGADLVPFFAFGEKWIYNMWNPPKSVRHFFLQTIKVPFLVFWGRFGTWMPLRLTGNRRFGVVYGKPISVTKNENPTDEEIAVLHAIYVERVKELFAKYKTEFGYDDDETLVIVSSKRPHASKSESAKKSD
ncbi:Aste57867_9152 [Aphanomyces stellatus]|uniref:Acyltransferase n=1 Tax=Aphanomyces stellatus TaxID=120398 RepID=A0A485KMA5_9STRA|nr:hypothetical protein As57867_009116 [Aphanomyces stellatus]VFT86036.1 Aste57867_9152 [Aphanomyces stellatus]